MFLRYLLTFLILHFFHLFVGINIYYILLIIRFHGYIKLFYNVGILKIIDTRNLSSFFFIFLFFHFSFLLSFLQHYYILFLLSFYLLVSTFFLSFFNLFVVTTIILLLLRFMVTFLFSMMWGGFKVRMQKVGFDTMVMEESFCDHFKSRYDYYCKMRNSRISNSSIYSLSLGAKTCI